jgi:hypothetical protein
MTTEENEQDRSNDLEPEIETDPPAGEEEDGLEEGQVKREDNESEPEPSSLQQDGEEEIEVSLGEESDETESGLITDLRQRHRKLKQKYRKTQYELDQLKTPQTEIVDEPGPKPTLEACDYDSDEYDKKISTWFDKKHRAEAAQKEAAARAEKEKAELQRIYHNYEERKNKLKKMVKDFDESEDAVTDALSITKQNIILCATKKPELIVCALGKSPAKMEELSKLDDIQFSMELARLEDNLKVGKRKPKTKPEKTVNGTGTLSGTTDRTLERLRQEAAKTGDMSKVMQYRRKKRRAAAG